MLHKPPISDTTLNQNVTRSLIHHGFRAPCSIVAHTSRGVVTLSGKIEFEHQRAAAVRAVHQVDGVRYVADQMQVIPHVPPWQRASQAAHPSVVAEPHDVGVADQHPA